MSGQRASNDVAIVGMSAMFANGSDLASYWQAIINKVDAVHEAPDSWAMPYYDPSSKDNDRIYTRRGGFLGDRAEFNPSDFGIMPNAVDGGEPDQYLALKMAHAALKDAGYVDRPFNREKTGIILGRGTYVNRGYTNLMQHGMMVDQTLSLLRQICPQLEGDMLAEIRQGLKDSLPPFTPDMSPGLVPNVVSGRIANRLDLRGPNFIVDAACASSLVSVELAIKELLSGRCDMVLAGGIHASTPPQIYMIFCNIAALSRGKIRPFDTQADGTLLGEGLGVLVLKRLADAQRDNDRIYAVLKGVGTASDGKALGLLAPRLEGEVLALQRAYQENGIDPATVGLVEAHGTGIPLGDQTEVKALSQVFGARGDKLPPCALGSVKSMISHCIPAAGVAAIIKSALALYHKVLPPTLCDEVNPQLGIESTPFYINTEARPWIHGKESHPRRAGVNAFGFGGINAHAVLEEYCGPQGSDFKSLHAHWPTELCVFAASDQAALASQVTRVRNYVKNHPQAKLAEVAAALGEYVEGPHRLAIVASDLQDLSTKIDLVLRKFSDKACERIQTRNGVYYCAASTPAKIAFLFPGEGAQYTDMLADLCLYFPSVRKWFDLLDRTYPDRHNAPSSVIFAAPTSLTPSEREQVDRQMFDMDLGSETVFIASMALNNLLQEFAVIPQAMLGHSTGENAALFASGVVSNDNDEQLSDKMRLLNGIYEKLRLADSIPRGALLTVGAVEPATLGEFLKTAPKLDLAIDNCPNQVVLFGQEQDIAAASAELARRGGLCARLPFDRAYHTPLFETVGNAFRPFYDALTLAPGHTTLYSCVTADVFPHDPSAIRELAVQQWSSRVRFRETIQRLYADGFNTFVEAGPSGNLTSFVQDTLRDSDSLILSSNSRRKPGLEQIQNTLGRLFVHGTAITLAPMYAQRELAPINLDDTNVVSLDAGAGRKKNPLTLEVPRLHLKQELLDKARAKVQASLQPARIARDDSTSAQAKPAEKVVALRPAAGAVVKADVAELPPVVDPRLAALKGHFDIMQEFLAGQARVMQMVGLGAGGAASVPMASMHAQPLDHASRWPLLGEILEHSAQSLHARRRLDLQHDVFLEDHTLGSAPSAHDSTLTALAVLPFTFSMEVIAEAAAYLLGGDHVVIGMQALRGYRWLTLDEGDLTIDIQARLQPVSVDASHQPVQVKLYQQTPSGPPMGVLVFEGEVHLAHTFPVAPAPLSIAPGEMMPSGLADNDLYSTGMFHGPRLQGVKHIRSWSRQGIEADLETITLQNFFTATRQPVFCTDAGLLDAAGQLIGYWLTEQYGSDFNCFPFQVDSFRQYAEPPPPGTRILCRAAIEFTADRQIRADFDLLTMSGRVIARLESWQDRHFTIPHSFYECRLRPQTTELSQPWMQRESGLICRRMQPFPEHFLEDAWAIWLRVLAHITLNRNERVVWYRLPEQQRTQWLLGRIAAKDAIRQWARQIGVSLAPADIEITSADNGKVHAHCVALDMQIPELAIAHRDGVAIAALAQAGQRLEFDMQRFGELEPEDAEENFAEQELEA